MRRFLLVAVAALVLTGCGPTSREPSPTAPLPTTTVPASTTTTLSVDEATIAFHDCLADRGVDIEPIPYDAQGRPRLDLVMKSFDYSDPEELGALDSCSPLLATGALDSSASEPIRQAVVTALTGFSECVRERGVPAFPDPPSWYAGVGTPYPVEAIPYDDPDLSGAVEVCRQALLGA